MLHLTDATCLTFPWNPGRSHKNTRPQVPCFICSALYFFSYYYFILFWTPAWITFFFLNYNITLFVVLNCSISNSSGQVGEICKITSLTEFGYSLLANFYLEQVREKIFAFIYLFGQNKSFLSDS